MSENQKRFAALDADTECDFFRNDDPRCPHCGEVCSVQHNEWWELYSEGDHEVTCPHCDEDFTVSSIATYTFSTDEQERDDD